MKNSILTDDLLYEALEIYNNEWTASEEFNKEKFETSEKFNKKMQKMIKSRTNLYHKATLTGLRRAVCVIAAILTLMLSTLSVGAVREAVGNFFVKIFATHDDISYSAQKDKPKNYPKTIEKIYELGYVPDGYELAYSNNTDVESTTMYFSSNGQIVISQYTKKSYSINVDNENTTKQIMFVDGIEYMVYTSTNSSDILFVWDDGEYIFSLLATLPKEDALNLCKSLKVKEN